MVDLQTLAPFVDAHRASVYQLLHRYFALGTPFLLRSELVGELDAFLADNEDDPMIESVLDTTVRASQEAAVQAPWFYLAVRPGIGKWIYLRIHAETMQVDEVSVSQYLRFKESLVNGGSADDTWPLEIDLDPFGHPFPRLKEARSIGRGVEYLNRHLSGKLLADADNGAHRLVRFLSLHTCDGKQLMLDPEINDAGAVRRALRTAVEILSGHPADEEFSTVATELRGAGSSPDGATPSDGRESPSSCCRISSRRRSRPPSRAFSRGSPWSSMS
jgi:sucrose synthase